MGDLILKSKINEIPATFTGGGKKILLFIFNTLPSVQPDAPGCDASAEVLFSQSHADVWSGSIYTSLMQSLCIHMLMPAICPHFCADVWLSVSLVPFQRFQSLPPQDKDLLLCGRKCRRHVPVSERVKLPQSHGRGQQSNSCRWPGIEPPPPPASPSNLCSALFSSLLPSLHRPAHAPSNGAVLASHGQRRTHSHTNTEAHACCCCASRLLPLSHRWLSRLSMAVAAFSEQEKIRQDQGEISHCRHSLQRRCRGVSPSLLQPVAYMRVAATRRRSITQLIWSD